MSSQCLALYCARHLLSFFICDHKVVNGQLAHQNESERHNMQDFGRPPKRALRPGVSADVLLAGEE